MILVDTSIWIDHLRKVNNQLKELLYANQVLIHPFIIGELTLGSMKNKAEIMKLLSELPEATSAEHDEVLQLIEEKKLEGTGIGWIDAHLVASALISGAKLITIDKPLHKVTESLGIAK
jgi:predicted nucleic acid-binding protein